ncbi:serpin family protein [Mucilaginibacter sp. FT3.2]|uniref:serpin family protein n=1 Tax=Mucilaginibacter sp. FT3.2 TaxID=2723090 RepID=UPI00161DB19E|nr:serpin family protein [Mucilaginibacter sp. FT3.2]MBB6233457.1 serpin B [Mucilaginibacter sp. FT3.2]
MIRKAITLLSLSALTITACKKVDSKPDTGKDLSLTAAEQQKVAADNAFSLKLFNATLTGNADADNLFLSPLSVSMAVGMTSNGAFGQTLHDIRNTMNFNGFTEDQVNSYYHKMITELPQLDPKTTLKFANSIWYANTFTPIPAFLQANASNYNARVQSADFTSAATRDDINNWVSNATDGKITNIIDNNIPTNARMYLINAIYFKSGWATKFDATQTKTDTFYLPSGGTVQTPLMNGEGDFNSANAADARILELPYTNNKFSMVILMPTQKSVKEYAAGLDSAKWQTLMAGLGKTHATVTMPKFKFSYDTDLKNILSNMGMANAFSDIADFTRINAAGGLSITEVKHKAYVEVNEDGTTAAAVTSVSVGATVAAPNYFKFDHPFIFAIREMKTGLVLFTGVVNNPTLSQ